MTALKLLAILVCVVSAQFDNITVQFSNIPEFVINLDLPPEERFIEVGKHFGPRIVETFLLFKFWIPE